jgi:phage terminase large subunit GpA-like protein
MAEFAEQEIIIPSGEFEDQPYRISYQPFIRHWFDAIDSGKFSRHVACGCVQSGKSTSCHIIPTIYHLFEFDENVLDGLPTIEMGKEKWTLDFEPILQRTRYWNQIPQKGAGSRAGNFKSIKFKNGQYFKFLGAGGRDKQRAHIRSRVLCLTEVDDYDKSGEMSSETDKVSQMEGRLLHYKTLQRREYMECNITTKTGRIYRELIGGTNTRIGCPCPYCQTLVTPEREHLQGWQEAKSEREALEKSFFCCSACGHGLTNEDREKMNRTSKPIHQNNPEETITFSFRWNAFNNLFWLPGDIGIKEWKCKREENDAKKELMEKELCQYYWTIPYEPPSIDTINLNYKAINARRNINPRGEVPAWAEWVVAGCDTRKRLAHYVIIAFSKSDKRKTVIDYGKFEVAGDYMEVDEATLIALRDFRDRLETGYPRQGSGERIVPQQVWIDSGYTEARLGVYEFCKESGFDRYKPSKGFGSRFSGKYYSPKEKNQNLISSGTMYHIEWIPEDGIYLVEIDSDFWKTKVHQALAVPMDGYNSTLTLFDSLDRFEHVTISKHYVSEKKVSEFILDKGQVERWICTSKENHFFDCTYQAFAAGDYCGANFLPIALLQQSPEPRIQKDYEQDNSSGMLTPDGRSFSILDR